MLSARSYLKSEHAHVTGPSKPAFLDLGFSLCHQQTTQPTCTMRNVHSMYRICGMLVIRILAQDTCTIASNM